MIRGLFKMIFGFFAFVIMFSLFMALALPFSIFLIGAIVVSIMLLPFKLFLC